MKKVRGNPGSRESEPGSPRTVRRTTALLLARRHAQERLGRLLAPGQRPERIGRLELAEGGPHKTRGFFSKITRLP